MPTLSGLFYGWFMRLLLSFITTLFTYQALALDVIYPTAMRKGQHYVKVTNHSDKSVSFEECLYGYPDQSCRFLGKQDTYTQKELREMISHERLMLAVKAGGAAAVSAVGVIIGITIGTFIVYPSSLVAATTAVVGVKGAKLLLFGTPIVFTGLGAGALSYSLVQEFDKLNPYTQYKKTMAFSKDLIEDKDIYVNDRVEMNEFVDVLDDLLSR